MKYNQFSGETSTDPIWWMVRRCGLPALLAFVGLLSAPNLTAQSNASELEDGFAVYSVAALATVLELTITDLGGGTVSLSVADISTVPPTVVGTTTADDASGWFNGPGAANPELTFTGLLGETLAVHIGTPSPDDMSGTGTDAEIFFGMDDIDSIVVTSSSTNVLAFGGMEGDYIETAGGSDVIFTCFRSTAAFSGEVNYVYAGDGTDFIYGCEWEDHIFGEGGDDFIWGGRQTDYLYGGSECDNIFGDEYVGSNFFGPIGAANFLGFLGATGNPFGDDYVEGGSEDDFIRGEDGDDDLYGEGGQDAISGGRDQDYISGGDDADWLHDVDSTGGSQIDGGSGSDHIWVLDGNVVDTVETGSGTDSVWFDTTPTPGDQVTNNGGGTDSLNPAVPGTFTAAGGLDAFENHAVNSTTFWGSGGSGMSRSC